MKIRFAAALFALSLPLLAQDPAASEALFYKAYWLQNGERNFAEAMTLYDKFLQAAPEHPLVGRAAQFQFELLTRAGKTDEAKAFAQKYEKQLGKVAVAAPAAPKAAEGGARPAAQAGGDNAQRIADMKKQLEEAKASGDEETVQRLERQIRRMEQGGGEAGAGGPGGRGARGGMFGSKQLTEMTAEERAKHDASVLARREAKKLKAAAAEAAGPEDLAKELAEAEEVIFPTATLLMPPVPKAAPSNPAPSNPAPPSSPKEKAE